MVYCYKKRKVEILEKVEKYKQKNKRTNEHTTRTDSHQYYSVVISNIHPTN